MLGKLLKYEFKGTGRILLPFYGLIIVLAIVTKVFDGIQIYTLGNLGELGMGIVVAAYGSTIVAVMVLTMFLIIQRFAKTVYGDEGYLTNTLPVKTSSIIGSKLISAMCWIFFSGIVALLSVFIIAYYNGFFNDFIYAWNYWIPQFTSSEVQTFVLFAFEGALVALLSAVSGIMLIYMVISIGQLFKRKFVGAIGAFIGVSFVMNTITGFFGNLFFEQNMMLNIQTSQEFFGFIDLIHSMIIFALIFTILKILVYFFATNYIMKNKLNLE